jgi:Uma2 family endonuclease
MTAIQRVSSARPVPVRFTAEEFMELAQHPPISEWSGKIELIEGKIVRMSPAHMPHWNAQRLTIMHLQHAFAALGDEWVIGGEAAVRLGR